MCPIHNFNDNRRARERLCLTTARQRAFLWSEKRETDPLEGFGFLADFSDSGAGLYLGEKVSVGELVRVAFDSAGSSAYRGQVVWASRFSLEQRFVGHRALSYRVGIKMLFGSEAERARYSSYLEELLANARTLSPGMIF